MILWIVLSAMANLYSQNQDIAYPHVTPMTPNAAELAKYADYPVSYYTGTPNTSIPIYEIDADGFKLPISLNYHASGIRVDQEATWVGLGWSLDVGGRVSRTVNSADDFYRLSGNDKNFPYCLKGYYDAPDINSTNSNQYQTDGYNACPPVFAAFRYDLIYDPEPDIFYYNLPGMNGKFILDKSRGAVLFDKSHNLKIELTRDANTNAVTFKITDSEGNQHIYDQREITKNYTGNSPLNKNQNNPTKFDDNVSSYIDWIPFRTVACDDEDPYDYQAFPQSAYPMVTSWCLTKVITKHGREISFAYDTETQYLPTQESCEKYTYNTQSWLYYYRSKIVNTALRLKSIEGDFGRIEFNCSLREDIKGDSKKLDLISIYDARNSLIKSFKFDYTYFNDDYTGSPQYVHVFKRLKLNKLTEYSASNVPLNGGHLFNYYEGSFPAKNSKNVDYWGFQNGKYYGENYYIGLALSEDMRYEGVRKDANFDKAIIGTLQKITYPARGAAEFKFESNVLSSYGFFNNYIYDGQTNYTIVDLPVYNAYSTYPWDENTPSQAVHSFEVTTPQTKVRIKCSLTNWGGGIKDPTYWYNDSHYNPLGRLRKISPTANTVYTYVCPNVYDPSPEYYLDNQGLGTEVDIAEREFSLDPGTYEFIAYKPPRDVEAYWRLTLPPPVIPVGTPDPPYYGGGIRISEIKTDAKTRKFNYQTGLMLVEPVIYYIGRRNGIPGHIGGCVVQVSESRTPLSTFSRGNIVGYDWVEEYMTDEDGNISKTRYDFHNENESELFNDNFPDSPRYINYMNGLAKSVEKYKNNILVEKDEFLYNSTYGNYIKAFRDRGQHKFDRDILDYYYRVEWPLKSNHINTLNTDDGQSIVSETNYAYNSKDLLQSVSQSTSSSQYNLEITEKMKYPFDFSDPVSLSMVSKNMIGIPLEKETFRGAEKLSAQKTVYKDWGSGLIAPQVVQTSKDALSNMEDRIKYNAYDAKGNPLEAEQPGGMKVSYIWGYKHTQPIAKLENIAYSSIPTSLITAIQNTTDSATGTEAQILASLNALRNSTDTNIKKAMITTFTYKPLVGVTSIIDPKGQKTTYEYDSFGRLVSVKDHDGNLLSENKYNYRQN